jgi:hypothetical protein
MLRLERITSGPWHALVGLGWLIAAVSAGKDDLGAVSSESAVCSEIGIELLKRGVSAFVFLFP